MLSSMLDWLASLPPTLIWGVFVRLYGLLFAFAIGQLYSQVRPAVGVKGAYPMQDRLARLRADHPNPLQRFFLYPTLHWFFTSDASLQGLIAFGALVGGGLVLSGLCSPLGFGVMWAVYLSNANTMNLVLPWDCLLLESGFLALFLPALAGPASLHLSAPPAPLLAFAFRWLIFRLMIGFGKFKFIGASTKEFSYLRQFMVSQPLPNIIGRMMYHLPLAVHVVSLAIFFVSEIVVPFFFLSSGSWRMVAGLITIKLMMMILLTGNFGFFNVATSILCMPMLDGASTVFGNTEGFLSAAFAHGIANSAMHLVLIFLFLFSFVFIPFNSWCTASFFHWPALSIPQGSKGTTTLGRFLRLIGPYHFLHAYGVFFPHSTAGVRWIAVIEGTDDERVNAFNDAKLKSGPPSVGADAAGGVDGGANAGPEIDSLVWRTYEYKFMTVRTDRMPRFCAPWHQRLDQAILYESVGLGHETLQVTLTSGDRTSFDPAPGSSMLSRMCACLLRDNLEVESLFKTVPFPTSGKKKVQALRLAFYMYSPTALSQFLTPGPNGEARQYWNKKYVGAHAPIVTRAMVQRAEIDRASLAVGDEDESSPAAVAALNADPSASITSGNGGEYQTGLLREPEMSHPDHYLAALACPAVELLNARLDAALALAAASKSKSIDSAVLIATDSSVTKASRPYVQPISVAQVVAEFWGGRGFVAKVQPLLAKLTRPAGPGSDPTVPPQDFEHHLAPGVFSASTTAFLASEASPLRGMSALRRLRLEKMFGRATLLMVRALLPLFHGPGVDEMVTVAQIAEAGAVKKGKFCLRPCTRDSCTTPGHIHLPSFFHLHLFAQHLVLQGREVFESVLADPSLAASRQGSFSLATGLLYQGLLHPYLMAFHAAKLRISATITFPYQLESGGILPGFLGLSYCFIDREYRTLAEGAFSPVQHLPTTRRPARYDQVWEVDSSKMSVRNANGLVDEDSPEALVAAKAQTNKKRN